MLSRTRRVSSLLEACWLHPRQLTQTSLRHSVLLLPGAQHRASRCSKTPPSFWISTRELASCVRPFGVSSFSAWKISLGFCHPTHRLDETSRAAVQAWTIAILDVLRHEHVYDCCSEDARFFRPNRNLFGEARPPSKLTSPAARQPGSSRLPLPLRGLGLSLKLRPDRQEAVRLGCQDCLSDVHRRTSWNSRQRAQRASAGGSCNRQSWVGTCSCHGCQPQAAASGSYPAVMIQPHQDRKGWADSTTEAACCRFRVAFSRTKSRESRYSRLGD